jgi:hypothetical protein
MTRAELRARAGAQQVTATEIDPGWDELTRTGVAHVVDGRLTLRE